MTNVTMDSEWSVFETAAGFRPRMTGNVEELRQAMAQMGEQFAPLLGPPDESVMSEDVDIGGLLVRVYTPAGMKEKLPVGIFTHGGGLVLGNLDAEDHLCRYLAKHTPCIIVSVDYHLAPESKVPQQIEDTFKAVEWVLKSAASLNVDLTKVFTIGGSAGGGLALAVACKLIDQGRRDALKGVVALNPVTVHPNVALQNYTGRHTSYEECGVGMPVVERKTLEVMFKASDAIFHPEDTLIWPLGNPAIKQLPALYVAACELDPLRDDAVLLAKIAQEAGVPTRLKSYAGLPHYFWLFPQVVNAGERLRKDTVEGIRFVLDS